MHYARRFFMAKKKQDEQIINKTRNAYIKAWRRKNPEKVKQYNEQYWLNRAKKEM